MQRKHAFLLITKEKAKYNKVEPKKKVYSGLLHQILGHRSTISSIAGDNANFWQDIKRRIDPDPFFTLCQISSIIEKG